MKSTWTFLIGLGAGATLALLLAPQSARKMQKMVSQKAQKGLDQLAATAEQAADQMKEWVGK